MEKNIISPHLCFQQPFKKKHTKKNNSPQNKSIHIPPNKKQIHPQKINMEPENDGLEDGFPFPGVENSQVPAVNRPGCIPPQKKNIRCRKLPELAFAIVSGIRRIHGCVHTELVATTERNPLQPSFSRYLLNQLSGPKV